LDRNHRALSIGIRAHLGSESVPIAYCGPQSSAHPRMASGTHSDDAPGGLGGSAERLAKEKREVAGWRRLLAPLLGISAREWRRIPAEDRERHRVTRRCLTVIIGDYENRWLRAHHVTPKQQRPKCGARTRSGQPCQALPVWDKVKDRPRNGRCRLHGGLSTGPRTPEGRARVAATLARTRERRAAERRPEKGMSQR
jgi:hypothetical protein